MAAKSVVDKGLAPPKKGEKFHCKACGMELEITKDCNCKEDEHVHFHCCGQEMTNALNRGSNENSPGTTANHAELVGTPHAK